MSSQSSYSETITTAAKAECHNSQVNMIGLLDATHKAHTYLVHMPPCFNTSAFEVLSASMLFLQTELPCPPKQGAQRQLVNLHIRSCCHNHSRNPHQNLSNLSNLSLRSSRVLVWCHGLGEITSAYGIAMTVVLRILSPWFILVHLGSSWFTQL